jgi:hypothetical protein
MKSMKFKAKFKTELKFFNVHTSLDITYNVIKIIVGNL